MKIPLHEWSSLHGKRAFIRSGHWVLEVIMDRFPRTNFPQNGWQCDSSVATATPTWVITRIEDSHSDGGTRFFQNIFKLQPCWMRWNMFVPIRVMAPLSCAGLNVTQDFCFCPTRLLRLHGWATDWRSVGVGRCFALKYTAQQSNWF